MISYLGDFAEDDTVYIMFNTFTSNDPSASCTITNFVNTDVHIHKDDGLTQRNNAAGITVSVDFDGITGSHMVKIDTSDDTVGGFWVVGHEYFVRIEGTTIDGATINSVIGQFSIENRFNEVDVVKWLGTAAATPTVAGVPEVDMTHMAGGTQTVTDLKDFADEGYNPADNKVQGVVLVDTTTTNTDMVGTDNAALAATALTDVTWTDAKAAFLDHAISTIDTNVDTLLTRITAAVALASICTEARLAELDGANLPTDVANVKSETALIVADTNELQGDWANTGRLDTILDACALEATVAALNNISTAQVNTEVDTALGDYDGPTDTEMVAAFTEIKGATWAAGTDTMEHIRNKQTDIETDTAEIGTAGAGLTDLGGMSTGMKAEVNTEADTALTDYDAPTDTEMIARTLPSADYVVTTDTIAGVTTATNLTNAPTSGDLTATMKASVNTEAKDVLTVDTIADSYATDGSLPTIAQAILAIQQMMQEKSITGTTLTVKKPDGSTSAMTFTLDSATTPTSITRAT